ncbi:unnamed protein product [Gongylonema pulchrum]|uniref:Protein cornichon homolog 2 n=1 Tax=Gongylonema pulchrum TaxID=637853 RepID=A0A183EIG3_9BILA|nr:unnamed protein product [Gongylonema pulchrum]
MLRDAYFQSQIGDRRAAGVAGVLASFFLHFPFRIIVSIRRRLLEFTADCLSRSQLVLPEYLLHFFFTFLFALSFQFGGVCWNLPLIAYHVHRYMHRPVMSGPGIYDPTTIFNQDELQKTLREGWIKLGFYLISFFYYLYSMIHTLVTSSS